MEPEQQALRYLTPVARATAASFTQYSFEYGGINEEFDDFITYKGWAIEPCIYYPLIDSEPDDFLEDSFIIVTWLETEDCWCKQCDEEFGSDEDAIAYVMRLIDLAEVSHSTSPGQLSLFAGEGYGA